MVEITPETAVDHLRRLGRIPPERSARAEGLGWGVSNVVVRVEVEGELPFVVKQSRERLRTKAYWASRIERIWSERDALELLGTVLGEGAVPRVLFSVPEDYLFAMTAAPTESVVWKEQLLEGTVEPDVARRAGVILGRMHTQLRDHPGLSGRLADTTVFDELRVDPFYRTIARAHPEVAPAIDDLIASMAVAPDRTFVHADFSPKNILVHRRGLTVVDFETAHAGDPAFDVGFFLSHITLKAFRAGDDGAKDTSGWSSRSGTVPAPRPAPGTPTSPPDRPATPPRACWPGSTARARSTTSTTGPATAPGSSRGRSSCGRRSGSTTWHEKCRRISETGRAFASIDSPILTSLTGYDGCQP